ncbi:uncharacterized protein LOC128300561 [Anopheles moucheti]|uniref:uncharacterized protein LOC128300561 n=1 Tax=Anopheles moucheti TaxID=186751 RepID=UPI0022F09047|nr:uncharacterized protein LOC128300561 [Anopheles moucheti]
MVVALLSMWAIQIFLRAYYKWSSENSYWLRKITPLFLNAFGITFVQYRMETFKYPGASFIPLLIYEACRLLVMKLANNKNRRKITLANSMKKHLRLPMLAYILRGSELFQQEAIAQICWWKLLGSGLETVYRLMTNQTNSERSDQQDNNGIEFMDNNNQLVKLNRSQVAMDGYYVEGYYIDLFCHCFFILLLACKYPELWKWVILRLLIEIPINFINVYISKRTIDL